MAVTPEAAGSSPVDPANYLQFKHFHTSGRAQGPPARRSEVVSSAAIFAKNPEENATVIVEVGQELRETNLLYVS